MLHLLKEYAEKRGLIFGPGIKEKDVRWCLNFDAGGKYLGLSELGDASLKKNPGRSFQCPDLSFTEMKAGGITKSHFLVETADVVALFGKKADDAKIKLKHSYFIKLLNKASDAISGLSLIANQLEDENMLESIRNDMESRKVKSTDKVTFMVEDEFLIESKAWLDWWQDFRKSLTADKSSGKSKKETPELKMRSFLSGELVEPIKVSPKINKLSDVGGQPAGDALCSFKQDSFCSFGLHQAVNSAVSEAEAYIYAGALNDILKKHSTRLAGTKVAHWFKEIVADENDPLSWLEQGAETDELNAQHRAKELLKSIRTGKLPDMHENFYYALTLSGASGRVMVRDWMEGQFEELVENIKQWFSDLEIVNRHGDGLAKPPKFMAVLSATVRKLDDLPAPFVAKMWRSAVKNEPLSEDALAQALLRMRVDVIEDQPANHARMGLLKAYHIRKNKIQGKDSMMKCYLNEEHPEPAYHCGRLMAVYASLQRAALGDVGAGVIQRYYTAASATPALILGRVANTSQHHISKLDSKGLAHWYENKIAGIWCQIKDNIPATLTLEEQSLFALGFYQQIASREHKDNENNNQNNQKETN
ncbi:MAG: type I-C CRISPR-associated protein Cas8c/Csd1 [candidate division Zixibacteria bacterium]|nr:type I-C CRISPR-associated protein Cas8c/Csd1 [candidate division Zixibacteria bacterium]